MLVLVCHLSANSQLLMLDRESALAWLVCIEQKSVYVNINAFFLLSVK